MSSTNYGIVYTKTWVVDLILDLAGYFPEKNLAKMTAVEPSCGEGAFAVRMAERLVKSIRENGVPIEETAYSLQFIDLDKRAIELTRNKLRDVLLTEGITPDICEWLLSNWCKNGDYLSMPQMTNIDFVIGNPPYIRSNDLDAFKKLEYAEICKTMTPGSDVFVGFIEKGIKSLAEGGRLTFICADRWMHNSYGKKLRKLVSDNYCVNNIIVMHDVDAFESDVSAYPAIFTISRAPSAEPCRLVFANSTLNDRESANLRSDLDSNQGFVEREAYAVGNLSQQKLSSDSWPLVTPAKQRTLDYLEKHFPLLEDSASGTKVGIGIATGSDRVFIVDANDIAESDRLVPLCTSRQLNRGDVFDKPLWLVNPWDDEGDLVDLNQYPKLKSYFDSNREVLSQRHIAKKSESQWFRTIDKYRPGLESRPKLLIQDMHARFEPFFDDSHYPHGNLYYLTSDGWDLEVLGGLLMSDICELFIDAYGVKMRGGTLRFQAQFLRKIHVPFFCDIDEETRMGLKDAFLNRDFSKAGHYARNAFGLKENV